MQVHILTVANKWTIKDWEGWKSREFKNLAIKLVVINSRFNRFERIWKLLSHIITFFMVIKLTKKYSYDFVHEFSSSPIMINKIGMIKKFISAKTIHSLITSRSDVWSHQKWAFVLPDVVTFPNVNDQYSMLDQTKKCDFYVLESPIDSTFFEVDSNYIKNSEKEVVVLYFGLLNGNKGFDQFIKVLPDVMRGYANVNCLLITPPDRKESLENKNKEIIRDVFSSFNERFVFIEKQVNVPLLMSYVDILVYPLSTMHGTLSCPSILIEALASGVAVVAPDFKEIKVIISHQDNGLIYANNNLQKLNSSIRTLVKNKSLRDNIRNKAPESVMKFNSEKVAGKLLEIYKQV